MSIYVTEKENLISISPVYIQSKYGTVEKTKLFVERKEMNVESVMYWRRKPKVFVNFSAMRKIERYLDPVPRSLNSLANLGQKVPSQPLDFNPSNPGFNTLSDDFFDDPEYKDQWEKSQKLVFYFSSNQPNDFKLIMDFSQTQPKERPPSFSQPRVRAISPLPDPKTRSSRKGDVEESLTDSKHENNQDEPVAGSDTTSDTEDENGATGPSLFHENSFEDFEKDDDENAANVEDKVYSIDELLELFLELHSKSTKIATLEHHQSHSANTTSSTASLSKTMDIILKQEQLLQLNNHFKTQEAMIILNNFMNRFLFRKLTQSFFRWVKQVKNYHHEDMKTDRHRWRLHAAANQELDLQAWYHALFYKEVYRLRGHFWYKDAVLPAYKQSYDLVDNALTPLEEAALAHVLCSPDTSYGDVAGQMFIVQSVLSPKLFTLFQQLASQGAQIVKYPRQGRPAKKLFRFSFVDGNIYLTWKGKFGNQGVGMYEVTGISTGIHTDVLKWSGQSSKSEQYLSLLCADRSVDLLFETEEERNNWKELLTILMSKEQGLLPGIEPIVAQTDFDSMILYTSIGKKIHA